MLLQFVMCLLSKKKLIEGADIHDSDLDSKILAISSDISTLIAPVFTSKHLGLTVYLHHIFGSKKLIKDINTLSNTMSYSEVRLFFNFLSLTKLVFLLGGSILTETTSFCVKAHKTLFDRLYREV